MYQETIEVFAEAARTKSRFLKENPTGFGIAGAMAGAYVGVGILLIFSLGQAIEPALRGLVMGACFGIALTLVVFAGAELFTGHVMTMGIGVMRQTVSLAELGRCWAISWLGNLVGALLLAILFVAGGGGQILKPGAELIFTVAAGKIAAAPLALLARAILCNWLVCLALWCSARARDDISRCVLIFWCVFAFIACGFEHCVANMTVFAIALLGAHPESVSLGGAAYNLFWVTLGNVLGGLLFVALGYWQVSGLDNVPVPITAETAPANSN
jgi:nitrite transporter NirC